jgi:hypothetical protein
MVNMSTQSKNGLRALIYPAGSGRRRFIPAREIADAPCSFDLCSPGKSLLLTGIQSISER